MHTIDARGLACPQPVIMTRNEMLRCDELQVLVSGQDSVNNIRRLADKSGWLVEVSQRSGSFELTLKKGNSAVEPLITPDVEQSCELSSKSVILVASREMGRGNTELGEILSKSFFYALSEANTKPQTLILINSGITLAIQDSPVLEALQKLAAKGVEILVCGTCLGYLNLREKLAVGSVTNMYTIVEILLSAGHTITL
ncbi:MAG: sulfurtransferase-like selenium metabolism protein YedF [Chloroflexi bacterium]|nr:sulfurtransferase-like selenium metabolism protein YedF [Chloroflexota bacterium]